mgnify:CR=1 FL=1
MSKNLNVIVHTDGACKGNPGPGSYAAILRFGKATKEVSGKAEGTTTAPRMELQAVVAGLEALTKPCSVVVKSDNRYVISGLMMDRYNWIANNWLKSNGDPVAHQDLWQRIFELEEQNKLKLFPMWIPREQNAEADALAQAALA